MKGIVEIYSGFGTADQKLLYTENNLIVDGAINLGYTPFHRNLAEGIVPQWAIIYSYKLNMAEWLRSNGIGAMKWPWLEIPCKTHSN